MSAPRTLVRAALAIIVVQLLRAVVSVVRADPGDLGPDGATYLEWARLMATQRFPWPGMGLASSTLLHCMWLTGLARLVGPGLWVARLANVAIWLAILRVSLRLVQSVRGATVAWVAVATLALDAPHGYVKFLQYEPLLLLLTAVGTALVVEALARPRWQPLALAGVAFGMGVLTQSRVAFLPVAFAVVLLERREWRTRAGLAGLGRAALALGLPLALVAGFWTYRNYCAAGRLVFSSGLAGSHLFLGNNPYATGTLMEPPWHWYKPPPEVDEETREALYRARVVAFVREQPLFVIGVLVPRKMVHLFELKRPSSLVTVFLMLAGMVIVLRRGASAADQMLFALVAYIVAVHAVYYGWGRYRLPALPAIHAFVAVALTTWAGARDTAPTSAVQESERPHAGGHA